MHGGWGEELPWITVFIHTHTPYCVTSTSLELNFGQVVSIEVVKNVTANQHCQTFPRGATGLF